MTTTHAVDVLLVDDNASDVELTLHVLQHNRLANCVHIAEDGQEALDFIFCRGSYQSRSIDDRPRVILLDLKLPKVDGMEVLKAIRSDERTKTIPVVLLTSSREQRDLVEGYKLGANAFIQKPVDFEQFQKAIQQVGMFWLIVNEPPPREAFSSAVKP
jgi:CheY-like chemotaxis protein